MIYIFSVAAVNVPQDGIDLLVVQRLAIEGLRELFWGRIAGPLFLLAWSTDRS